MNKAKFALLAAVLFFSSKGAFGQVAKIESKEQPKTADPCTSAHEFATTDCALTWHGITLYGVYAVSYTHLDVYKRQVLRLEK